MGNLCGGRAKSEDKPKSSPVVNPPVVNPPVVNPPVVNPPVVNPPVVNPPVEDPPVVNPPPAATLSSILDTSRKTLLEIINEIMISQNNSIFTAKIILFEDSDIISANSALERAVITNRLTTIGQVRDELISYINRLDNRGLNSDTAGYFIELFFYIRSDIINNEINMNIKNFYSNSQLEEHLTDIKNKCYQMSIQPEGTRVNLNRAKADITCYLVTTYKSYKAPAGSITPSCSAYREGGEGGGTTEKFRNKNDFIKKEIQNKLTLILKGRIESFRNKKVKRENNFTGYSLEYSPLLPKDYAEF